MDALMLRELYVDHKPEVLTFGPFTENHCQPLDWSVFSWSDPSLGLCLH